METKTEMTNMDLSNLKRKIVRLFFLVVIFLAMLMFLPAGTLNYWQAYVYILFLVVPMLGVLFYFLKKDPHFLVRRIRTKEKEKTQRTIQFAFTLLFLSAYVVSGLDRRFGWSVVPVAIVLLANALGLLGYWIVFLVFKQNSFASRVVEVVPDQKVISTGLYSLVRHPMYLGVIIMWIPAPIALGSWWGMIPMATIPLALIFRIFNEETVLSRELPGYSEYCQKTRFRLIPYLW